MFNLNCKSSSKLRLKWALVWSGVISLGAIVGVLSLAVLLGETPKPSVVEMPTAATTVAPPASEPTPSTPAVTQTENGTGTVVDMPGQYVPRHVDGTPIDYERTTVSPTGKLQVEWYSAKSGVTENELWGMLGVIGPEGERAEIRDHVVSIISSVFAVGDAGKAGQLYLMLAAPYCDGPCSSPVLYRFTWQHGSKPVLLEAASSGTPPVELSAVFALDDQTVIEGLDQPKTLKSPSGRATFININDGFTYSTTLIESFRQPKLLFTDPAGRKLYTSGNCYALENLDFSVDYYVLDLTVLNPAEGMTMTVTPKIRFNDGNENAMTYLAVDPETKGCSANIGCLDTLGSKLDMNQVRVAGTLANGSKFYEPRLDVPGLLTDKTRALMEGWGAAGSLEETAKAVQAMTVAEKEIAFMKIHPVLVWKGPLGEWIVLKSIEGQPMAECGKPVIYLYPQQDTVASVKVSPTGGLTKTEPAYEGGWKVLAHPDGRLTNLKDGTEWPYLFWEGYALGYARPREGFVVSRPEVDAFLAKALAAQGLSAKESADFREFWVPKMQEKPYYFVTFLPQADFDRLAPLAVQPTPDTVIRVFMDYEPLEAPATVRPQRLTAPERRGFTVVEWGGQLRH